MPRFHGGVRGHISPREISRGSIMREYSIAAIPGDGIGSEVIAAGLEVLQALAAADGGFRAFGSSISPGVRRYYLRHGYYIPPDGLARLKQFDAIFFGAVGAREVPDHASLWGLRLPIAQGFDQYANVRPARVLPGVRSPLSDGKRHRLGHHSRELRRRVRRQRRTGASWLADRGGHRNRRVHPCGRGAHPPLCISRWRAARPRRHLTLVTKSNAQRFGMVMWDEIFYEVAQDFPDVATDRELVDAVTTRMVLKPATLDVVVATNLYADILSDLAAALSGSLGIAPTANLNPERSFPSMFEPIHGSAFDITGKGIANPIATFWTAAMMLDHLGEPGAAARLMKRHRKRHRGRASLPSTLVAAPPRPTSHGPSLRRWPKRRPKRPEAKRPRPGRTKIKPGPAPYPPEETTMPYILRAWAAAAALFLAGAAAAGSLSRQADTTYRALPGRRHHGHPCPHRGPTADPGVGPTGHHREPPRRGATIGADAVAKARPDGYTLLMAAVHHTIAATYYKQLPYDLRKDLTPVSVVAIVPNVLVVRPDLPVSNVRELIAYAKANPGKLTYASNGPAPRTI